MPAIVRLAMGILALLELVSATLWIRDPEKEEKNLSGLLLYSGCTSSIACGADGVCAAYGRVMAWALLGLGMLRLMLCFGSGFEIWLIGILGHMIESVFWWSEYTIATLPRLRALPSAWTRECVKLRSISDARGFLILGTSCTVFLIPSTQSISFVYGLIAFIWILLLSRR